LRTARRLSEDEAVDTREFQSGRKFQCSKV
jgi:hypothetical protein